MKVKIRKGDTVEVISGDLEDKGKRGEVINVLIDEALVKLRMVMQPIYESGGGLFAHEALVRLETPVVYFYSDKDTQVSLRARLPGGHITEWYPAARVRGGEIAWDAVHVRPGGPDEFPQETTASHYYAARDTDAAPVRVVSGDGVQDERFLFYRGVGAMQIPLLASLDGGRLLVRNVAGASTPEIVVFENRGGSMAYSVRSLQGVLAVRRPTSEQGIDGLRKELEGITSLWEKNLVQFGRVVALQRDLARAEGDSGQLAAAQAESKNKIAETELQILQIDEDLRSEVGKELATLRADLDICTQRKIAAEDVFSRIEIRAPQDGTVHEMSVHIVGGVVASGEELLQIVPANDTLDVWAKVPPESVDQVHVGQTAVLRFPAFDPRSTPEIDATVAIVSADLIHDDKTDERYYSARIAVPPQRLQELGLRLLPGMPVEAFIRTEDRTVVSYVMKPLNDQIKKAFRER
jgi:HlyD family secretion protein